MRSASATRWSGRAPSRKLVRGMSPDRRDAYRELFEDVGRAAGVVAARRADSRAGGPGRGHRKALAAGLAALKAQWSLRSRAA